MGDANFSGQYDLRNIRALAHVTDSDIKEINKSMSVVGSGGFAQKWNRHIPPNVCSLSQLQSLP